RLRVKFNGTWVADTTRGIVLHETRKPPSFYIPWADVRTEFLEKTDRKTHCPFKGNASYWTLRVAGEAADNAVWAYEQPSEDAAALKDYVSFYASKVSAIYEDDEEITFLDDSIDSPHANPIGGWLLREAWKAPSADRLVEQFCDCLLKQGVPLARMTIIVPTLHPQIYAS